MITLTTLLLFAGLNYEAIDKIPLGGYARPQFPDSRWLRDASIEAWARDDQGVNLYLKRDSAPKEHCWLWTPWADADGRPWLWVDLPGNRAHLWQGTSWRALKFRDTDEWKRVYASGDFDKQFPPKENFGVIKSFGSSGETGSLEFLKCEIHQDGPCPGPGPCPRPQPRPRPDDSLLPPININPQINLDSNVIAAAIFASFLLMTVAFTLLALAKRRAS